MTSDEALIEVERLREAIADPNAVARRERDEALADVRAELARAEAVLVAADRVREAYEAMIEGRDIGCLPDWQRKA